MTSRSQPTIMPIMARRKKAANKNKKPVSLELPKKTRGLLVGEGDFSFTLSVLEELKDYDEVFITSLESEEKVGQTYAAAANNIRVLKEMKPKVCHVYHEVDATSLMAHPEISLYKYDLILFNKMT